MAEHWWSTVVDRAEAIRFTGYHSVRGAALDAELARVGLAEMMHNRWVVQTPYLARFMSAVDVSGGAGPASELIFGMYGAARTAVELGAERLLVVEDDVEFASDVGLLRRTLEALPGDFSVARLCWMLTPKDKASNKATETAYRERGGRPWIPCGEIDAKDTGATIFSRQGMENFVRAVENDLRTHRRLGFCDSRRYVSDAGRVYLAAPLMACQREYRDRMCRKRNYPSHYAPFSAPCGYGGAAETVNAKG